MKKRTSDVEIRPPVTDYHKDLLKKVIQSCRETEQYCRTCEDCGLDVGDARRINAEQLDVASRLLKQFFGEEV